MRYYKMSKFLHDDDARAIPASILRKSTSGRWRPDTDLRRMLTGMTKKYLVVFFENNQANNLGTSL